ncbi:uncharacterized protein [Amphiura filiformis]|uniref:uncharacterized protein n=1 Tax=Amphiura filiformis TaxID=82378 RepID=UPI003B20CD17
MNGDREQSGDTMLAMTSTSNHQTQRWDRPTMDETDLALDKLTELAIIATGPQSPLLQPSHQAPTETGFTDACSFNNSIHSYAKPPPVLAPVTPDSSLVLLKTEIPNEDNNNFFGSKYQASIENNDEINDKNKTPGLWTALDSSAALALSDMARSHSLLSAEKHGSSSAPTSPVKKRHKSTSTKLTGVCKRPMNAFMLFAKRFRLEYTQLHPGKDNRAISIILGDKWKQLCKDEREAYTQQAKVMADEYKKTNPDCWKRKRSHSTST